jgi:hypothetical protein
LDCLWQPTICHFFQGSPRLSWLEKPQQKLRKKVNKHLLNLIGQSAVILFSFSDRRRNFYLLSKKQRKMAAVLQAFEVKP